MSRTHQPPQVLALAFLLAPLACGADPSPELETDALTETSSGTEPADSSAGPEDDEPTTSGPGDMDLEPECGNAIVEADEVCDDGELNGSLGHCAEGCQGLASACGDGIVQDGETCDDGNAVDGDGCNRDCRASGTVVWEREYERYGQARAVDVGEDGAIYVAGQSQGLVRAAWAVRLGDDDGADVWSYELPTPADAWPPSAFYTVRADSEGGAWFGGTHDGNGRLARLDDAGLPLPGLPTPGVTDVTDVRFLPDGDILVKQSNAAARIDGPVQEWSVVVGYGLAHRPGDDEALAAVYEGAGFRRFTIEGEAFEPVMFPVDEEIETHGRTVAWTSEGDVIVAGEVLGASGRDALVLRSSPDGELRWMHLPQALHQQNRFVRCLAVDAHDAIIVGGYTWLLGAKRPFLMKLSPDGTPLWTRALDFEATDAEIHGCDTTSTDEIVAVGFTGHHPWFAKLTP